MKKELDIKKLPKYLQERVEKIEMESAGHFGFENVGDLVANIKLAKDWVDFEGCKYYVATSKKDLINYLKNDVKKKKI